MKTLEQDRRGWILVSVLLITGLLCVFMAGGWAIRFPSSWRLPAGMGSSLNPDSEYLTRPSSAAVQPLAPSILTQPVWIDVFLTPGAVIPTRITGAETTPLPVISPTPAASNVPVTSTALSPTPTSTVVFFPATQTSVISTPRKVTSTATLQSTKPPAPSADLAITKTDNASAYAANGTLTYTITVLNNGPTSVTGAVVTDPIPAQIASWTWTCSVQNGATGCDGMSGSTNFSDTVNLPAGAGITYTVNAMIAGTATGTLANTASVGLPAANTDPNLANNTSTDTDSPGIDLQISKSDGVTAYTAGDSLTYTVLVANNSSFTVNGALVTDVLPTQVASASWTCLPAAGATCTPAGTGSINDVVNLPPGLQVTYTITASISSYAYGMLTNTAAVTAPAGFVDIDPGNNSAIDSDVPMYDEPDVGPPDGSYSAIPQGTSLIIVLSPAIAANGDFGTPDFVYYERLAVPAHPNAIELDWVQIEISADGITWYQVFYWGDPGGAPDIKSNVDVQNVISDLCLTETDNCVIPQERLYNATGITIDIDGLVPPGFYPWIRISSPPSNDESEVDAIQPYYP
jgi:uncharacterized repeat protein (TIGR01451 family)